jgi:hypothetical protein
MTSLEGIVPAMIGGSTCGNVCPEWPGVTPVRLSQWHGNGTGERLKQGGVRRAGACLSVRRAGGFTSQDRGNPPLFQPPLPLLSGDTPGTGVPGPLGVGAGQGDLGTPGTPGTPPPRHPHAPGSPHALAPAHRSEGAPLTASCGHATTTVPSRTGYVLQIELKRHAIVVTRRSPSVP